MIYVSSSCVKNKFIWQSVEELALEGFTNIELSGGTQRNIKSVDNLNDLKEKYNLNYRCHNYFPPPVSHFVMNIATDSNEIFKNTLSVINEAIKLSEILNCKEYGFHAGFLTDITTSEIGKSVSGRPLFDLKEAQCRFYERVKSLVKLNPLINLYVENNVVSQNNFINFNKQNCFLLTSYDDVIKMKKAVDFNFLLDIAHLFVSCNTLGKNFRDEFRLLSDLSNYIHISDNNGKSDENKRLKKSSEIYLALTSNDLKNKTFTLEINDDMKGLIESYSLLEELL